MTFLYYDPTNNTVSVATTEHPIQTFKINEKLYNIVPDGDVFFVQSAKIVSKKQLLQWLINPRKQVKNKKLFVHPRGNGSIVLEDIKTEKYPNGLIMHGKYDFISVDDIGMETLNRSAHYRIATKNKRIELVDEAYVKANLQKGKSVSPKEMALDRILIQDDYEGAARAHAENIKSGAIGGDDIPVLDVGHF